MAAEDRLPHRPVPVHVNMVFSRLLLPVLCAAEGNVSVPPVLSQQGKAGYLFCKTLLNMLSAVSTNRQDEDREEDGGGTLMKGGGTCGVGTGQEFVLFSASAGVLCPSLFVADMVSSKVGKSKFYSCCKYHIVMLLICPVPLAALLSCLYPSCRFKRHGERGQRTCPRQEKHCTRATDPPCYLSPLMFPMHEEQCKGKGTKDKAHMAGRHERRAKWRRQALKQITG